MISKVVPFVDWRLGKKALLDLWEGNQKKLTPPSDSEHKRDPPTQMRNKSLGQKR
jgi:hypothetical protein